MQRTIIRTLLLLILALFGQGTLQAKDSSQNAKEAKELFDKVYTMVFGEQGSRLTYSVNIIGIYKTQGDIIYKGKKIQYQEPRYVAYENGVDAYMVDQKKKTVSIYRADDDRKDVYLSKFKYNLNDFEYSYKTEGDHYILTAKLKNASLFGIREVQGVILKKNLYPTSLTIKLACFHTTVQISNFCTGGIEDSVFTFPKDKYKGYKITDYR